MHTTLACLSLLLLGLAHTSSARTFVPPSDRQVSPVSGLLDEAHRQKRSDTFFNLLEGGEKKHISGVSKVYNEVVDIAMEDFVSDNRKDKAEGNDAAKRTSRILMYAAQNQIVNEALAYVYENQCQEASIHSTQMFFGKLEEKDACLSSLNEEIDAVAVIGGRHPATVKEATVAKVTCNILPRLLDCLAPALVAVSNCSVDAQKETTEMAAIRSAIADVKDLLDSYCAHDTQYLIYSLRSAPSTCVSEGVNLALKYVGPSFLADVTAKNPHHLPCEYLNFISTVLKSVLNAFCQTNELTQMIQNIASNFSNNFGCVANSSA